MPIIESYRLGQAIISGQSIQRVQAAVRDLVAVNGGRKACLDEPLHMEQWRWPALHLAVLERRHDIIGLLLQEGASPNAGGTAAGASALRVASDFKYAAVLQQLLDAGADVNTVMSDGSTALMEASQEGAVVVVHKLLSAGARVDLADDSGDTALVRASENGHHKVVQQLLDAGADVNKEGGDGITALMEASEGGDVVVVHKLLSAGARVDLVDDRGDKALNYSSRLGHHEVVQQLLDAGAKVNWANEKGRTALTDASFSGHEQVVQQLIRAGAEVEKEDSEGCTALLVASQEGDHAVVQLLLEAGADPNHMERQAFDRLLEAGADPNHMERQAFNRTPLFMAAHGGYHRVTQLLLISGANANLGGRSGFFPLYAATEGGHGATYGLVVEQLIAAGAELESRTGEWGRTPLMGATIQGSRSIVRKLLRAGAEVNAISSDGFGAIHLACAEGHARVAEDLISAGADVEMLTVVTPLMMAAANGHGAVVRVLLSAGADTENEGAVNGGTPLFHAAQQGHSGAALELLSGGASLTKALTKAREYIDGAACIEFLLAAERHHFASQSALDLMRGTDLLFSKEGRLKVSQRELSPEVLQEVAEEMA